MNELASDLKKAQDDLRTAECLIEKIRVFAIINITNPSMDGFDDGIHFGLSSVLSIIDDAKLTQAVSCEIILTSDGGS